MCVIEDFMPLDNLINGKQLISSIDKIGRVGHNVLHIIMSNTA